LQAYAIELVREGNVGPLMASGEIA